MPNPKQCPNINKCSCDSRHAECFACLSPSTSRWMWFVFIFCCLLPSSSSPLFVSPSLCVFLAFRCTVFCRRRFGFDCLWAKNRCTKKQYSMTWLRWVFCCLADVAAAADQGEYRIHQKLFKCKSINSMQTHRGPTSKHSEPECWAARRTKWSVVSLAHELWLLWHWGLYIYFVTRHKTHKFIAIRYRASFKSMRWRKCEEESMCKRWWYALCQPTIRPMNQYASSLERHRSAAEINRIELASCACVCEMQYLSQSELSSTRFGRLVLSMRIVEFLFKCYRVAHYYRMHAVELFYCYCISMGEWTGYCNFYYYCNDWTESIAFLHSIRIR